VKVPEWMFWLFTIIDDAIFATLVWLGLKWIDHSISWWACFAFMVVATGVFKSYEPARQRLEKKGLM